MITINAGWVIVVVVALVWVALGAHFLGWRSGWKKRTELADEFERILFPLECRLGFARARAGWADAEEQEAECAPTSSRN